MPSSILTCNRATVNDTFPVDFFTLASFYNVWSCHFKCKSISVVTGHHLFYSAYHGHLTTVYALSNASNQLNVLLTWVNYPLQAWIPEVSAITSSILDKWEVQGESRTEF
jgi:hypothetical protein